MLLRPTTAADLAVVHGWIDSEAAMVQWSGPTFRWPLTLSALLHYVDHESEALWARTLVDEADRPLGLVRVRVEPGRSGRYGWVIVDPARRGQGLGRALVRTSVAAVFADRDLVQLTLGVYRHNTAARRLYEEIGFVPTGLVRTIEVCGATWEALEFALNRESQSPAAFTVHH